MNKEDLADQCCTIMPIQIGIVHMSNLIMQLYMHMYIVKIHVNKVFYTQILVHTLHTYSVCVCMWLQSTKVTCKAYIATKVHSNNLLMCFDVSTMLSSESKTLSSLGSYCMYGISEILFQTVNSNAIHIMYIYHKM